MKSIEVKASDVQGIMRAIGHNGRAWHHDYTSGRKVWTPNKFKLALEEIADEAAHALGSEAENRQEVYESNLQTILSLAREALK